MKQFGGEMRPDLNQIRDEAQNECQNRPAAIPPLPDKPQETDESSSAEQANYFLRHWRGELSLGVSYWVNGVLAYALVAAAVGFVSTLDKIVDLKATSAAGILPYALSLVASVWQIVGVWRSASKHVGRGGRAGWAAVAKLVLILGVVNLGRFTVTTIVPQSIELANIVLGDTRIPAYEIRVLPGGNEVEFRGGLRAGAAKELERILNAVPQAKVLHINSIGGRVREGKQMAKVVRERGLVTYTSEECLSAATLVFIAGKERVVAARAKVGFHQPSLPGMTDEQRRDSNASTRQTMRSAGISDEFINQVLATAPENMWYPSIEEMQRAGVITSESFGERFAASGALLRGSSPEEIDKVFGDLPGFRAIKKIEPGTYQKMVNEFSAAILSGKSVAEAQSTVRGIAEQLMLKYLPVASDEALRAMRDLWVEMLVRFKDQDSRACIAVFSPKSSPSDSNYGRIFSQWSGTNNLIVIDQVLRSATVGARPPLNAGEAERDLASILSTLSRKYGDDFGLLVKENEWMRNSGRVCEIMLALYRETQKIPEERQGNLLRYMLSSEDSNSSETAAQSPAGPVTSPAPTAPRATGAASTEGASTSGEQTYTVKSSDNLTKIGGQFGTTIKAPRAANGLETDGIRVGQTLSVPTETSTRAFGTRRAMAPQDPEEAARWYREAAEQGIAEAQAALGRCYAKGEGVARDYDQAANWYRKAAEQGDARGQNNLGVSYAKGQGVAQDYGEAVKWYRKAAEQGYTNAQCNFGNCYLLGHGVQQDYAEAANCYRKAAEQGDARGQYNLGVSYAKGQGVAQDYGEAVKWYRKAAEQGHTNAQCNLGNCYSLGHGVQQDYTGAANWYRKAAEQGDATGQNNLGLSYEKGRGVSLDLTEAIYWYIKALEQGFEPARNNLARAEAEQAFVRPSNGPTQRTSRPLTSPATPRPAAPPGVQDTPMVTETAHEAALRAYDEASRSGIRPAIDAAWEKLAEMGQGAGGRVYPPVRPR